MFSICLLPASRLGPDGQRLGQITIGDFIESFACHPAESSIDDLESDWRTHLRRLLDGAPAIALIHDPRFAWIIYREGSSCYVQQHVFPTGDFGHIPPRETVSEDGQRISEWTTSAIEIQRFLAA